MHAQPAALLRHQTPTGSHYDWLLGIPGSESDPAAKLWTARVDLPSTHWRDAGKCTLTRLPDHRRAYLSYQGPISGGRGQVIRVDRGQVLPLRWTDTRILLDVQLTQYQGRAELRWLADDRWVAFFTG